MKTRIVILDGGWKTLGKSKIFDWPFDQLPEKDNAICKETIPEVLWNSSDVKDSYQSTFEGYQYHFALAKSFFHDSKTDEKLIEILIEI